jgi:hypothetical protein
VNLEFDTDFIVELTRQIVMPINTFTNDFTNIFQNINLLDLKLNNIFPKNIDINVDINI